jgi:uncharacterized protein (DUF1501 family)
VVHGTHTRQLFLASLKFADGNVWRNTAMVTFHNFARTPKTVRVDVATDDGGVLYDYFDEDP